MKINYIITILKTNEVNGVDIYDISGCSRTEYSYSTLKDAKSLFSAECKKLKHWGELIFERRGDFYTTLIMKRTYRNRFDAVSIKLRKELVI